MNGEDKTKYGLTVKLHDFGQKTFEAFQNTTIKAARDAFYAFGDGNTGVTASASVRGETVRGAVRLGILTGITLAEIDEMKPHIVDWLANEIKLHVTNVTTATTDPN